MIHKHAQPMIHVNVDTSLTGNGAIWDEHVYAATYPPDYLVGKSIVHLEMCNIWVLVQMWGSFRHGKLVRIYCNNEAVVRVLSTGRTRDDLLGAFACLIWAYTASRDIQLQYSHIAGVRNILADTLSRYLSQGLLPKLVICKINNGRALKDGILTRISLSNCRLCFG